MRNNVKNYELD